MGFLGFLESRVFPKFFLAFFVELIFSFSKSVFREFLATPRSRFGGVLRLARGS